jgi:hypothetical protein
MMEAVIVITVLLPLFIGMVYFRLAYTAKLRSLQNARAYAFTYALHGCNDPAPGDAELAIQNGGGAPSASTAPADDDTQGELSDTGNPVPNTGTSLDNDPTYTSNVFGGAQGVSGAQVGTVTATSIIDLPKFNGLSASTRTITSSAFMQCAPTPVSNKNIWGLLLQTGRNFANW